MSRYPTRATCAEPTPPVPSDETGLVDGDVGVFVPCACRWAGAITFGPSTSSGNEHSNVAMNRLMAQAEAASTSVMPGTPSSTTKVASVRTFDSRLVTVSTRRSFVVSCFRSASMIR